jgi:hypothetical protein
MESPQSEPLDLQLLEAQETLELSLEEACAAEVSDADTGQLIRIEKALALANEAAREVISIRQQRPPRARRKRASAAEPATAPPPVPDAGSASSSAHRIFVDASGVQWDACAIHPSSPVGRVQLPEPYRSGWLYFESATQKRRLSPIPDAWRTESDDTLRALCERADLVPERASSGRRRLD